ncbi:MAG: tRNA (adenosine(37)-N6)-threonylcarbamoyltransferase complex transferase subunit TsaD [SAR324 cluster bacterium]|nr:tRNA (adenosine(37)-N6)-threonylcarbamoyltransferase complex transferase subunit TsaD [SAR324 cluster bacterium]
MIGLGIDTTFDDTSIAILKDKRQILANVTLSQYKEHERFGGVVPERASRKHLEVIHPLLEDAMVQAKLEFKDLNYITVSNLPGLLGSLLIGVIAAKAMAYSLRIPLIGVNHVEAHPYANFLSENTPEFPIIHLVVAGGHTLLMYARNHFDYEIIGRSQDDAAGECVDKVAKMFGQPMPGGPFVDACAMNFTSADYDFPRPLIHKPDYNFSFSGLKTAMLYFLKDHPDAIQHKEHVLSSFFQSVTDVLLHKTFKAVKDYQVKSLSVSGGLAASKKLRTCFEQRAQQENITLHYPPPSLCTDNAAMVACLGAYRFEANQWNDMGLEAYPNIT